MSDPLNANDQLVRFVPKREHEEIKARLQLVLSENHESREITERVHQLVGVAVQLAAIATVPPSMSFGMGRMRPARLQYPGSVPARLQGVGRMSALEFEPLSWSTGDHPLSSESHSLVEYDLSGGVKEPFRALGADGASEPSASVELETPLLASTNPAYAARDTHESPRTNPYMRLLQRITGLRLMVFLTLFLRDEVMSHSDLPGPVQRYSELWKCVNLLSPNKIDLLFSSPQSKALDWFVTGAGRHVSVPAHYCTWGSDFASLYALLVVRESLTVPDASWYSTQLVNGLDDVCRHWKRVECNDSNQITSLILNHAHLVGTLPEELAALEHLKKLHLYSNPGLMGSLPATLSHLTVLREAMFQKTSIAGTVPSEMGHLKALEHLLLQDTLLTGTMPDSLCQLRETGALGTLDASCRGDHAFLQCSRCTSCTS